MGDAEALLLIDDDEAEPLEINAFGQQRMGADNDIDRAVGEARLDRLRLLVGDEAGEAADIDREAAEAFLELHMMLAREQGGGADEDDLHPRHRRDEGGAQGDFGLAEAHVAADEAIHRLARSQILDHVADRAVLILGFLIGEAIDKGGVARDIGFGDGGGAQRAFGGGLEQFTRDFADALLHLGLAPLPGFAAQLVEAHAIAVRSVAGEDFEIFDRHEQLVATRIAQGDAIMRRLADRNLGQPFIAANAMVHVDDEVAGRQGGEFREEGVGILLALGAADEAVAQHILFGQDRDIGGGKAMVERQDGQRHAAIGGDAERFLPAIGGGEALDAMVEQQAGQSLARAARIAGDHHLFLGALQRGDMFADRFVDVDILRAFGREVARAIDREVQHVGAGGFVEGGGGVHRPGGDRGVPFGGVEIEQVGL